MRPHIHRDVGPPPCRRLLRVHASLLPLRIPLLLPPTFAEPPDNAGPSTPRITRRYTASPSAWLVPVSATLFIESVLSSGSNAGYVIGTHARRARRERVGQVRRGESL
ncbi:hypothetical protein DFH09DRAFT_1316460 [Mycena vulgaris]|nr:hypothetical protein DFH09DRAFT_1316460 [Mycena vulgaris]